VVCVLTYSSEEEALRIANDTAYGLGAALWTADPARGRELARKIAAGTVWVNDYHLLSPRFPFGGFKRSGFGRELGPQGLKAYQQIKHIHVGQPQTLEEKYYFNLVIGECDE
jgi:aldehyde dehydrogenase (NAD+)